MSENASDSENTTKPVSDTAKPKGARKAGKKAEVVETMKRAKGPHCPRS